MMATHSLGSTDVRLAPTRHDRIGAPAAPGSPDAALPSALEPELLRQTLIGEQRRRAILAPLLTGLVALAVIYGLVAHFSGVLPAKYGWILLIGSLSCGYEWLASRYLRRAVEDGTPPARFRFFFGALVELGLVMVVTLIAATCVNPVNAISGPVSFTYFLFIILSALRLDFSICLFTGAVSALAYSITVAIHANALAKTFPEPGLTMHFNFFLRALMFLLGGLVAGLVSVRIRRALVETLRAIRECEQVTTLFGQHVSPLVADRLLAHQSDPVSELRTVCVLVLDIRDFTGFAEKRSPAEVVGLLNRLWTVVVHAVDRHHGFVNKFLGDGILAVFGAPEATPRDCAHALAAARSILRELDACTASGELPSVQVGIAVHSGEAILGNIGAAERKEYTVIGDAVNVAFRMEALNKDFGSRLVISEQVRRTVGEAPSPNAAEIQLRGRDEALAVHPL